MHPTKEPRQLVREPVFGSYPSRGDSILGYRFTARLDEGAKVPRPAGDEQAFTGQGAKFGIPFGFFGCGRGLVQIRG